MHPLHLGVHHARRAAAVVAAALLAQVVALAAAPAAPAADRSCPTTKIPPPSGLVWRTRASELRRLTRWHRFRDSATWRLSAVGVVLCAGAIPITAATKYRLVWVAPVWRRYGRLIAEAAREHAVPAELILTVIATESGGRAHAVHTYAGFVSDARTPGRVSVGLGQMLLSTARAIMNDRRIDRAWLLQPRNAIRAIAVYLDRQYRLTGFDPPLVAAAYNAGALYRDPSPANRWRLRNHPVGRSFYIDNFVAVANGATAHLLRGGAPPAQSYAALLAHSGLRPRPRPDCGARCGE